MALVGPMKWWWSNHSRLDVSNDFQLSVDVSNDLSSNYVPFTPRILDEHELFPSIYKPEAELEPEYTVSHQEQMRSFRYVITEDVQ